MDNNNLDALLSATTWNDRSGAEIREFLQGYLAKLTTEKPAYFTLSPEPDVQDGCYRIYGFASGEAHAEWAIDPEANAALLLACVKLPEIKNSLEPTTKVDLVRLVEEGADGNVVTTDDKVVLRLRFISKIYDPSDGTTVDKNETGKLLVETRLSDDADWVKRGRVNINSVPVASDVWSDVDISHLLDGGYQQVRISVTGNDSGKTSRGISFEATKAKIGIECGTQWWLPVTDGVLRLYYYMEGRIDKTLNIRVDNGAVITFPGITREYTDIPKDIALGAEALGGALSHGIHTVEAWLSVTGRTERTSAIKTQVMVVADGANTEPVILVNDIAASPQNWAEATLFAYSVYDPSGQLDDLSLSLRSYDGTTSYLAVNLGAPTPETRYEFRTILEVEQDTAAIAGRFVFANGDTPIGSPIEVVLDNSGKFAPAAGYAFALNPRTRSNDEADARTVVNHADGEVVPSEWYGVALNADGWVKDDNGTRCLRVAAGSSISIDYEAFKDFGAANSVGSLTVELDFATRNVTAEDVPVISLCKATGGGKFRGLQVLPSSVRFATENKCTDLLDQTTYFAPEERTHVALTLAHDFNRKGINLVQMLVKGVISREMQWNDRDTINDGSGLGGIRIGSLCADIDIYNIRIYHRALAASDLLDNYISTLPSTEEKLRMKAANNIMEGGKLSYTEAVKTLPTMLWKIAEGAHLPRYGDDKKKYEIHCPETVLTRFDADGTPYTEVLKDWFLMGQGTSSMAYYGWNIAMNAKTKNLAATHGSVKGSWIDRNGVKTSGGYALDSSVPVANKLVAKANWASSQQSHKMGCVNAFHDLWKVVTGGSNITKTAGFEKARVAVKQDVFLGFVQVGNGEPQFTGIYTFGPGKGDKATFGCDNAAFPHYLMLEGCDNGFPLTNHHMPWDESIGVVGEQICFGTDAQFELCIGDIANADYFKGAFNFVYQNSPNILPFEGNYSQLTFASTLNTSMMYWVTQEFETSRRYDLYRYDTKEEAWVPAGLNKARLNVASDLGITPTTSDLGKGWAYVNSLFIAARVARFKAGAANYFNVDDALYHLGMVLLLAASDNRAKNTYLYLDLNEAARPVIRFAQDDLDTTKRTDNVGRLTKPYHVETLDLSPEGAPYWNGKDNAMYRLFELAYPAERRNMMNRILSAMASLAGTPEAFMLRYFTAIQERIPAVAYNETARVRYEEAAIANIRGEYNNPTLPLVQSVGSQQDAERHWDAERIAYLSSYCNYGKFIPYGSGSLSFRSAYTTAGAKPTYAFAVTPAKAMYVSGHVGSSNAYCEGCSEPKRVAAGETVTLKMNGADNDTVVGIYDIDSYASVGNFADKSVATTFELSGKRLSLFDASGASGNFRPRSFTSKAKMLRALDLNGRSAIGGTVDLTGHTRLEWVDLRGTGVEKFVAPSCATLHSIYLGAATTKVELAGLPHLTVLDMETLSGVESFAVSDCPGVDTCAVVKRLLAEAPNLAKVTCKGVNWSGLTLEELLKLADLKATLTGRIALATSATVDFAAKRRLVAAWGDVDSGADGLQIAYEGKTALSSFTITAPKVVMAAGDVQLDVVPNSLLANQFKRFAWRISSNPYATVTPDGVLKVRTVANNGSRPKVTVTATATRTDGSTVEATCEVGIYYRAPQPGDKVYSDGSYSDTLDPSKHLIGLCFWVDPEKADVPGNRLMLGVENITGMEWGISYTDKLELNTGTYQVRDVPNLTNASAAINMITRANYCDASNADGFAYFSEGTTPAQIGMKSLNGTFNGISGVIPAETPVPYGLYNTIQILRHRDIILNGLNMPIPSKENPNNISVLAHLKKLLEDIAANGKQYRQLYYPSTSACYYYEPTVAKDTTLAERFTTGHWWLPSAGELMRFAYYYKLTTLYDDVKSLLKATTRWYHQSSTEYSWVYNVIGVGLNDGGCPGWDKSSFSDDSNSAVNYVRPACAF